MSFQPINTRTNVFLAPMAGVCDLSFREICMSMGASLCVSEMVSAKAICYSDKKTMELLRFTPNQRPFVIQLFGGEAQFIARAIRILEDKLTDLPDGYDINMGCPAPKIVSNRERSALMKAPSIAADIVRATVESTELPVSVKHRSGWDKNSINAVDFARMMEDAGASYITVHPRTRDQFYTGHANLDVLRDVKNAVSIPVVGSGDLFSADDVVNMLRETNCDAVAIARGAQGNPWIFRETDALLREGVHIARPTLDERMDMILHHAQLLCENKGEVRGMKEFRKHLNWYLKGLRNATSYKNRANAICTLDSLKVIVDEIRESQYDDSTIPKGGAEVDN